MCYSTTVFVWWNWTRKNKTNKSLLTAFCCFSATRHEYSWSSSANKSSVWHQAESFVTCNPEQCTLLCQVMDAVLMDDELHPSHRQGAELHTAHSQSRAKLSRERKSRGWYRLRECSSAQPKAAGGSWSHHAIILHTWQGNQLPQCFRLGISAPVFTWLLEYCEASFSHLQDPLLLQLFICTELAGCHRLSVLLNTRWSCWFHFKLSTCTVSFSLFHKASRKKKDKFSKALKVITEKLFSLIGKSIHPLSLNKKLPNFPLLLNKQHSIPQYLQLATP